MEIRGLAVFLLLILLSGKAEYQYLCCNHAKEHCERIYGRI